jgi:hypothetical protein
VETTPDETLTSEITSAVSPMLNTEEHSRHKVGSHYEGRGKEYYTDSPELRFVSLKMFRAETTENK